jgi:hypothetical protein
MLSESTLATLPSPTKQTLKAFRHHFFNVEAGSSDTFPTLGGESAAAYDDDHDLVAVKGEEDVDRLTTFVQNHLSFLFHVSQAPDEMETLA